MNFHIGNFVKEIFDTRNTKQKALAAHLDYGASNTSLLFKRPDWYASQLHAASKATGINMFTRLGEVLLPYDIEMVPGIVMEDRLQPEPKLQMSWMDERESLLRQIREQQEHVSELKQLNGLLTEKNRELRLEINTLKSKE